MKIDTSDRKILRNYARQLAQITQTPAMQERIRLWKLHNKLDRQRPMMLVYPEGSWGELIPSASLECRGDEARWKEFEIKSRIYTHEHFNSDNVLANEWVVSKVIRNTGWGLSAEHVPSMTAGGAWAFKPVIETPQDMKKLHFPEITYDENATQKAFEQDQEIFGDILPVKLVGIQHIGFHLMQFWTGWRGLEKSLMDMIEEPEFVHEGMAFLEEGHRQMIRQYEEQNLLSANNDNTYHSTGGNGYIDDEEIFKPGFDPEHIRPCDMWASAESQELTVVRPRMHAEFAMEYEKRLLSAFGLNGYGCCDDFNQKFDLVMEIPHIRRVSVSPFCNVQIAAEKIGKKAIVSWKPQPSHLVGEFNEELIRQELRAGLAATQDCTVEIILKDTHTCENHPERFDQWTRICREEIEKTLS